MMENNVTDRFIWNHASNPHGVLLLTHGAGLLMDAPFMERVTKALVEVGITVARFEFGYMAKRRRTGKKAPPPRADKLCVEFLHVIEALAEHDELPRNIPLLIGGKSMGGRIAAMVASNELLDIAVRGIVCLGYPFHPQGKSEPEFWRLETLQQSILPVLICQGERDAFGWWDEIDPIELPEQVQIKWITDGSHDLGPTGKSPATMKSNVADAANHVEVFARTLA